jgi:hypothetical protein
MNCILPVHIILFIEIQFSQEKIKSSKCYDPEHLKQKEEKRGSVTLGTDRIRELVRYMNGCVSVS